MFCDGTLPRAGLWQVAHAMPWWLPLLIANGLSGWVRAVPSGWQVRQKLRWVVLYA